MTARLVRLVKGVIFGRSKLHAKGLARLLGLLPERNQVIALVDIEKPGFRVSDISGGLIRAGGLALAQRQDTAPALQQRLATAWQARLRAQQQRLAALGQARTTVLDFLDWLEGAGYVLELRDGGIALQTDQLVLRFLEIDPIALEKERRQLLEYQRALNARTLP